MILVTIFLTSLFFYSLVSQRLERTFLTAPIFFTAAGIGVLFLFPEMRDRKVNLELFLQLAEIGLVLLLFSDACRTELGLLNNIRNLPARLLTRTLPTSLRTRSSRAPQSSSLISRQYVIQSPIPHISPRPINAARMRVLLAALCIVLILGGCATGRYGEVWHKKPRLTGPPGSGPLAAAEQNLTRAMHEERVKPLAALGDCLDALQFASDELKRDSGNPTAVRDYNFGVSRIFQIIHDAKLDPWTQPLSVPTVHGDFVLTYKPDSRPEWNPALYEFTPADEFDVGGKYVTERTTRDGIGAPIVAVERQASESRRQKLAPSRIFRTVTAVAEFRGRRCVLEFYDPLDSETVSFMAAACRSPQISPFL